VREPTNCVKEYDFRNHYVSRDIKPENIHFNGASSDSKLKLIDTSREFDKKNPMQKRLGTVSLVIFSFNNMVNLSGSNFNPKTY
jgi:serine/threonine protein kinase